MRDSVESDLRYIEFMIYNIQRIRENMARFSQLGIDLSDEMVIENISFSLSQIGEQASLAKLSEQTKE